MPHSSEHRGLGDPLAPEEADRLAESMAAFATGSRLRLLWAMKDGERSVEDLSELTGLSQSATSQQLRVLRQSRLVKARRDGRRAFYTLHDHHLPELLGAIRNHHEHVHPEDSTRLPDDWRKRGGTKAAKKRSASR